MDLFHVRGDDHRPPTNPLPGALLGLWRHYVPDLEVTLPGDAKGLQALNGAVRCRHCAPPGTPGSGTTYGVAAGDQTKTK
jgi:hypothetical protein